MTLKNRFFNDNLLLMKKKNISQKKLLLVFLFISLFTFFSCSLNYDSESLSSSKSPEFVFTNSKYTRINEGKLNLEIKASKIEQYSYDNAMYAKDITFTLYDEKEKKSAEGKGKLLSANMDEGIYYLFDDISVKSFEEELTIQGSSLKWNDETEQLITNIQDNQKDKIYINSEKEPKIQVEGTGFSASGFDNSFIFTGEVSGEIITKD